MADMCDGPLDCDNPATWMITDTVGSVFVCDEHLADTANAMVRDDELRLNHLDVS